MGTRSLTHIKNEENKTLVTLRSVMPISYEWDAYQDRWLVYDENDCVIDGFEHHEIDELIRLYPLAVRIL